MLSPETTNMNISRDKMNRVSTTEVSRCQYWSSYQLTHSLKEKRRWHPFRSLLIMSCCSNGVKECKRSLSRRVPLKMLRPLTLIRSADEKLLSRVLGKFDIGVFFGKNKNESYSQDDQILEVLLLILRTSLNCLPIILCVMNCAQMI